MIERNYNYDILRIVACLCIICMHSPMPTNASNGLFLSAMNYFVAPGLCMFFVLSGSLLLPVKMDTFTFLKKRIYKIVSPTIFFSFVYLFLNIDGQDINWVGSIFSIPFCAQGYGILWFMYTLMGLYLLSPILSRWLMTASKREVEFYLLLWLITMCYPLIKLFASIQTDSSGILYYFTGYIGYFVLGYYLKTYPETITMKKMLFPTIIAIAAPTLCKLDHIEVDFYDMFWYNSIFIVILTIDMYKMATYKTMKLIKGTVIERFITMTSGLSFGIYLIHIAIMRGWLWNQSFVFRIENYYLQCLVIIILTASLSWILTYIISWLPLSEFIIGYKQKKIKS